MLAAIGGSSEHIEVHVRTLRHWARISRSAQGWQVAIWHQLPIPGHQPELVHQFHIEGDDANEAVQTTITALHEAEERWRERIARDLLAKLRDV